MWLPLTYAFWFTEGIAGSQDHQYPVTRTLVKEFNAYEVCYIDSSGSEELRHIRHIAEEEAEDDLLADYGLGIEKQTYVRVLIWILWRWGLIVAIIVSLIRRRTVVVLWASKQISF